MADKVITNEIVVDQPVLATNPPQNNAQLIAGQSRVSPTGVTLVSPQIGGETSVYTVTDDGIFSFGDGSDGSLVTSGNVTLTADKYYTDLTVSTSNTFNPAGYRIFCNGTLRIEGTVVRNGNNGGDGLDTGNPALGAGGAALADGYLKGSAAGGDGGAGGSPNDGSPGTAGANTSNSVGSNGSTGGAGGAGTGGAGGAGGGGGTATTSNVKLIANWHLSTLLDIGTTGSTVKFDNSAAAGGGGGGGGNGGAGSGSGGGGGGSAGGIVAVYAKKIVITSTGSITANGGNGGRGGDTPGGGRGGGGGGGGGCGGQVILVYNTLTNNGSITATLGTKGRGGTGGGGGATGSDGVDGTVGSVRLFQVSL